MDGLARTSHKLATATENALARTLAIYEGILELSGLEVQADDRTNRGKAQKQSRERLTEQAMDNLAKTK